MRCKAIHYLVYMFPILWSAVKDLTWEEFSLEEIWTHYLFGKANAYDRAHYMEPAIRIYKKLLDKSPNSVPVLLNLGGLYYRRGKYDAAIPFYERVIRKNAKHYHGHYWLAMCYRKLHRYHAAINTLEEVIRFLPTFKDALNLMGECYERIGEGGKAEQCYLKAISIDPRGIVMHKGMLGNGATERRREERIKH